MVIECSSKVVVMGVGNLLLRDEGVGVHVAQALQKTSRSNSDFEAVDGGTSPDALLALKETDRLIIIDAARGGGEPGTIYRFRPEDVETEGNTLTSVHQMGLLEDLWLMRRFKEGPKSVVIIGVEPEDISCGLDLSPRLAQRFPEIIRAVLDEVELECAGKGEKGR